MRRGVELAASPPGTVPAGCPGASSTARHRTVPCLPWISSHAQLRPGVGANGEGETASAAVEDLREALSGLIAEFGAPDELTLMLDVA
jgi:hypothetical protein